MKCYEVRFTNMTTTVVYARSEKSAMKTAEAITYLISLGNLMAIKDNERYNGSIIPHHWKLWCGLMKLLTIQGRCTV